MLHFIINSVIDIMASVHVLFDGNSYWSSVKIPFLEINTDTNQVINSLIFLTDSVFLVFPIDQCGGETVIVLFQMF